MGTANRPPYRQTRRRPIPYKTRMRGTLITTNHLGSVSKQNSGFWDLSKWQGSQFTDSEYHPGWRKALKSPGSKGDIGGSFFTSKRYVLCDPGDEVLTGTQLVDYVGPNPRFNRAEYRGPYLSVAPTAVTFPPWPNSSNSELDALGTTAIANTTPTNAPADLSVFLGETIREGIPKLIGRSSIWKDKVDKARHMPADEYLNVQFGWKPFISELRSIAGAIAHADAVFRQYERDAGRMVRRRMSFPVIKESSFYKSGLSGPYISPTTSVLWKQGAVTDDKRGVYITETLTRRRWFSGAFTYYLPPGYHSDATVMAVTRAKRLLNLSPTPEVIWNLAPWSWAVDWFTNIGDIFSNISSWITDDLALPYGYIMENSVRSYTYTYAGDTGYQSLLRPTDVISISEVKMRRKASPWGFGLSWDGFSAVQLAILAALGIKRT